MVALLLDTCAVIWLMSGEPMKEEAKTQIQSAADADAVFVSPITAWEIGTLVRRGRIMLAMAPDAWFDSLLSLPGLALAALPPRTLIASAFLPGDPPQDPADRIIAATARAENLVVVTRDRELLSYGAKGHARVLAC